MACRKAGALSIAGVAAAAVGVLLFFAGLPASSGQAGRFLQEAVDPTTLTTTTTPVSYPNFLCGDFVGTCERVAHIPFGPDIWTKATYGYHRDGSYTHTERAFFNKTACELDEPWMEIDYEGKWNDGGIAEGFLPYRALASIEVISVWITSFHDEVCVETSDASLNCMKTKVALTALCPCNGWDWGVDDDEGEREPRMRNVGMFCMPYEQCPILHAAYLQQTQYFWYTADASSVCSAEANTDASRGWARLDEEPICKTKQQPAICEGQLSLAAGLQAGRTANIVAFAAVVWALAGHLRALQ